jgi:tRNA1(Val) A37 N6-methylase TrmN6
MAEARLTDESIPSEIPSELSEDAWLGGRLTLLQPMRGHRVGSDAALLVAATGAPEGRIADVGAGVGAVGLALLGRHDRSSADLVEINPDLSRLAEANAARNGFAGRARVVIVDILRPRDRREAGLPDEAVNIVVTNPPFFDAGKVRVSPDAARAEARVFARRKEGGASLANWIRACLAILAPGGRFVMIHRPDALAAMLEASENRLGALAVLPVHPRAGVSAHRLLVRGQKGSKAPLRIAPALILHEADGGLTAEADAIHRGDRPIDWGV